MSGRTDISRFNDENRTQSPSGYKGSPWRVVGKVFSILLKAVLSFLFVCFVTGLIVGISMFIYIMGFADTKADVDLLSLKLNLTSFVYVNNPEGVPVVSQQLYGTENRIYVDLKDIPQDLRSAIVAIEDKRFLEHKGVDWQRTLAAMGKLFGIGEGGSFGGSTITQQLIKNITGENDVSLNRKIREIFSALNLEKEYTKDQILEAYLNTIGLSNGCNGVQTAAKKYFNKDVKDLSLQECASLAGITQNPSKWNPLRYPENNLHRTQVVLTAMRDQGIISESRYKEAYYKPLVFVEKVDDEDIPVQNWYMDLIMSDVIRDLMEQKGLSKTEATAKLYQGGLRIYSAMDESFQQYCEDYYLNGINDILDDKTMQSSLFMMDYTGRVLATVGSRTEKTANRLFNRSTRALRQPGSSIKPLGVYAPALELGLINYSSMMKDEPFEPNNGQQFSKNGRQWPKNHYGSYTGDMLFPIALARSSNATAVWTLYELTPRKGFDFITQKLHFTSPYETFIDKDGGTHTDVDYAPLAVGGFTEGVTAKEMCAGFQIFGNGGKFYDPYTYYYVRDSEQAIVLDNRSKTPVQALSKENASIMNTLLQGPIYTPKGTAGAASISGWKLFGKTGTTTANYDRWFVGGSPYAVAAVWTGYDRPRTIAGSRNLSVPIWRAIMSHYLEGMEPKSFERPSTVASKSYCKYTGLLANPITCHEIETGWYTENNRPATCKGNHPGAESSQTESSQTESKPTETPVQSVPPVNPPQQPDTNGETTQPSDEPLTPPIVDTIPPSVE